MSDCPKTFTGGGEVGGSADFFALINWLAPRERGRTGQERSGLANTTILRRVLASPDLPTRLSPTRRAMRASGRQL